MTTKTIAITDETIAKLEAAGFKRWQKNGMDRLYVDVIKLGAEFEYYNTGNVRSAKWCGDDVSNSDGRRLLGSKVYIDVKTGELHVTTTFSPFTYSDQPSVEDAASAFIDSIFA